MPYQDRQPATSVQVSKLVDLGHQRDSVMNLSVLQAKALIAKGYVGQTGPQPYAWKKNPTPDKKPPTSSK